MNAHTFPANTNQSMIPIFDHSIIIITYLKCTDIQLKQAIAQYKGKKQNG